ncbi:MAG: LysM peptidoglycan-binding domain-containing protein [Chloroflexi bacterium]|nr:LysM peptidoglycan-binding domain-containing protein [Chloroflexota bacterium]
MVFQRRLFNLLTVLVFIGLFVVACERPLGGTDDEVDPTTQTDADAGGGVDGNDAATTDVADETAETEAETDTTSGTDNSTTDDATADSDDTTQDDSAEAGGSAGEPDEAASSDEAGNEEEQPADDTAAEDATAEDDAVVTDETEDDNTEEETAVPGTHTVAAGENLFRIGLRYHISWVAIAHENNLANPHILSIGQVLKLPGATTPTPDPEPTPSPQTETTYIVKAGDNLYRIGLHFGISWVQIAEANGLESPNMIIVGSELKIPVNTPGPAPEFTHTVHSGETLFLISLQYGVTWPAIAEANGLTSPYVIYVGQTLQIPGSQ